MPFKIMKISPTECFSFSEWFQAAENANKQKNKFALTWFLRMGKGVEKQMFYGWAYASATMYLPLTLWPWEIFGMEFAGGGRETNAFGENVLTF